MEEFMGIEEDNLSDDSRQSHCSSNFTLSDSPINIEKSPASTLQKKTGALDNKKAYLSRYFKFGNFYATCTKCGNRLKLQQKSLFNLKKHYMNKHVELEREFLAAWSNGSERSVSPSGHGNSEVNKRKRQPTIEESFKKKFNQENALNLYYRFFISDMVPSIQTNSEPFHQFLLYICPEFRIPSRQKLTNDIKSMEGKAKTNLRHILAKQNYVATTADCWSFHQRFSHLFKDMDLLMATAVHPHYKMPVVKYLCQQDTHTMDNIKRRLIKELLDRINEPQILLDSHQTSQVDTHDVDYLCELAEMNLKRNIKDEVIRWSKIKVASKEKLSPQLFPSKYRKAWIDIFLKYNTPLPSSACVENNIFTLGSDILRLKKSALLTHNFEQMVFLKGNLKYINITQEEQEEIVVID